MKISNAFQIIRIAALAAAGALLLAGCGTVRGFGDDVRRLGEGIKSLAR